MYWNNFKDVGNIENTLESDMDNIYNVNIKGTYNCMQAVIPGMKVNGGVILNMASIASSVGISDRFTILRFSIEIL